MGVPQESTTPVTNPTLIGLFYSNVRDRKQLYHVDSFVNNMYSKLLYVYVKEPCCQRLDEWMVGGGGLWGAAVHC